MKILVVEDDRTVGQYVKRGLEEQHYQADLVDDGMEGLRLASGGQVRSDRARPAAAGDERARGAAHPARPGQHHADPGAHRAGRGRLQGPGAPLGRGRLRHQAVLPSRSCWPGSRRWAGARRRFARRCCGWATWSSTWPRARSTRAGERIELTPKEYTVLEYLMRHAGRVMSRTLITEYAWDYHFDPGTNIVDVVINRLRKKVDSGHAQKLVHTVRGVGYVVKV